MDIQRVGKRAVFEEYSLRRELGRLGFRTVNCYTRQISHYSLLVAEKPIVIRVWTLDGGIIRMGNYDNWISSSRSDGCSLGFNAPKIWYICLKPFSIGLRLPVTIVVFPKVLNPPRATT